MNDLVERRDMIKRITDCWNQVMDRNHVRKPTLYRSRIISDALREFTEQEICETIRWYAGQAWNKKANAWLTFDRFMEVPTLTAKYEQACDDRDKAEGRAARARAEMAKVSDEQQRTQQTQAERDAILAEFAGLPAEQREAIFRQALAELQTLHKVMGGRIWPSLECWPVRMQVIMIMKRRSHGSGSQTVGKPDPSAGGPAKPV